MSRALLSAPHPNPYLRDFVHFFGDTREGVYWGDDRWWLSEAPETIGRRYHYRDQWRKRYSYAVPTEALLTLVARYAPLVEIGAGGGYWSYMLQQRGADVVAYDLAPPPDNGAWQWFCWTDVERASASVAGQHGDRALLLCWPPYHTPMAYWALRSYRGGTVIYIGEGDGGCTGDEAFHDLLDRHWCIVQEHPVPQFPGHHDHLWVYRRKAVTAPPPGEP